MEVSDREGGLGAAEAGGLPTGAARGPSSYHARPPHPQDFQPHSKAPQAWTWDAEGETQHTSATGQAPGPCGKQSEHPGQTSLRLRGPAEQAAAAETNPGPGPAGGAAGQVWCQDACTFRVIPEAPEDIVLIAPVSVNIWYIGLEKL